MPWVCGISVCSSVTSSTCSMLLSSPWPGPSIHKVGQWFTGIASRAVPTGWAMKSSMSLSTTPPDWLTSSSTSWADEQKPTLITDLSRTVTWFNGKGGECRRVINYNRPAYVSRAFARVCKALCLRHIGTRRYTHWANVKVERIFQTLCRDWTSPWPSRTRWNGAAGCLAI
jgi:hypothetical protein